MLYTLKSDDIITVGISTPSVSNATAANFQGFSSEDAANLDPVLVMGFGTTNLDQSGLTVSSNYYVQEDGTLDTAPNPLVSIPAGRAIAPTKIVVQEPIR